MCYNKYVMKYSRTFIIGGVKVLSTLWEVQKIFADKLEKEDMITVTYVEELSELIHTLCKLHKEVSNKGNVHNAFRSNPKLYYKLLNDIADVEICLKQLEYYIKKHDEYYDVPLILQHIEADKIKHFALNHYDEKTFGELMENFDKESKNNK